MKGPWELWDVRERDLQGGGLLAGIWGSWMGSWAAVGGAGSAQV